MFKSGFVNIIGNPNVGKSTLINSFLGEKMSIITPKPQTTRHRILGIHNDDSHQIIFSDSPGIIEDPSYKMQNAMNSFAFSSFEDADILVFVTDINEKYTGEEDVIEKLKTSKTRKILVINKIDLSSQEDLVKIIDHWSKLVDFEAYFPISALLDANVPELLKYIKTNLPEGPKYYPDDQLSDKSERFFVSEIIRENLLLLYQQEIPYSAEVIVEEFVETTVRKKPFVKIRAIIIVSRPTQKSIIIGKGGQSIKQLGIQSRKAIEQFLGKRVHLETFVKVKEKWRNDDRMLKSFGYKQ